MTLSGGCQCGAVRYRAERIEDFSICHCRMCQKAFGNFGAPLAIAQGVEWTRGKPAEFRSSAIVARGFCAACGTPLYMREDGQPYEMAVCTLDEPEAAGMPLRQSGVESKLVWTDHMANLPPQETTDYRTPVDMEKLRSLQHPDHDTRRWPPEDGL